MSLITRYFSTASGAGDGTTWADRAALFAAGAWSSVINEWGVNVYGVGREELIRRRDAGEPMPTLVELVKFVAGALG